MTTETFTAFSYLIYEDSRDASQWLKQYLSELVPTQSVRVVSDLETVEKKLAEEEYSVLIVQVGTLPVNTFRRLAKLPVCPPIVVCSADRAVAADAYTLDAAGFVQQGADRDTVYRQLHKALQQSVRLTGGPQPATRQPLPFFFVKSDYKIVRINFTDILFVEAMGEYLRIYTDTGRYVMLQSLTRLLEMLPVQQFLRIHRSYIVNLYRINFIQNNVVSVGATQLPIGKSHRKAFLELIEQIGLF